MTIVTFMAVVRTDLYASAVLERRFDVEFSTTGCKKSNPFFATYMSVSIA